MSERKGSRRSRAVMFLAAAAAAAMVTLAAWAAVTRLNRPTGQPPREIRISQGMAASTIGQLLEGEGVVRSSRLFAFFVRLQGLEHELEAGTYLLDGGSSTSALISTLLQAPVRTRRVTVPEGLTTHETAALLARLGVADSTRFAHLTGDSALARELGIPGHDMEGYLYPETYFLDEGSTEEAIIGRMVAEFHRVFADTLGARLATLELSLHEVVTLASIIEREAVVAEERPMIAGVFLRRLELRRRLESCATVEYALGVHRKRLSNADLQVESPYNTYRHRGLPPGPIASPGRAALLAALYPVDTEFLYFVARGDGTHVFSRTNREHERAKRSVRYRR
jgi:UPF0755 protein